jgi:colanic acid biosynthesis glycosyl transferase WcaI
VERFDTRHETISGLSMKKPTVHQRSPGEPAILILTQYYRPEPNFITADLAEMLGREARVTVITAHPNYPRGRFYPGVRWWWPRRTEENGVVVWRLPMVPDHSNSPLRRMVSFLSFLVPAMLVAPWIGGRPALVWVYHTPFTTALAALWFKWVRGARLVYTCADLWPESFTAAGVTRPGRLMRLLYALRRWINRRADLIVCSTRGTLERFAGEGVRAHRLEYVPVWVEGIAAAPAGGFEASAIVYAGNLGPAQQLDTVVRAAAKLRGTVPQVTFELYGSGSAEAELRSLAAEIGADNVRFHGRIAPDEAFRVSSGALAQIVTLRSTPLFRMTIPSKLFFCFAAGAPLLYGLEGEAAELAAASGGGLAFRAGDEDSLVDAVHDLVARGAAERQEMRSALRRCYDENFSREKLLARYRELLTAAASSEAPALADAPPRPSPAGGGSLP